MPLIIKTLFSTEHLLYPCRAPRNNFIYSKEVDVILSILALTILGIVSAGFIPIFYIIKARNKFSQYQEKKIMDPLKNLSMPFLHVDSDPKDPQIERQANISNSLKKIIETPQTEAEFCSSTTPTSPSFKYTSIKNPLDYLFYMRAMIHNRGTSFLFPPLNIQTKIEADNGRKRMFQDLCNQPHMIGKRVSIDCDGKKIDAYLFGKKENIANGRWALFSNGHTGIAEYGLWYQKTIFENINSNYVLFNYPGMGCSEGPGTRDRIVTAYQAVLGFIEDDKNGLGAKECICWGTSMGGGVKGHALKRHTFKEGIRYVSVSDRTYRTLQDAVSAMKNPVLGSTVKQLGWQLSSKSSSKLPIAEIVLHKAKKLYPETKNDVEYDGFFGGEQCLAGYLLSLKSSKEWPTKRFIGLERNHCEGITDNEMQAIQTDLIKALEPNFSKF